MRSTAVGYFQTENWRSPIQFNKFPYFKFSISKQKSTLIRQTICWGHNNLNFLYEKNIILH